MLDKLLDSPWEFLVLCVAISILLYSVSKFTLHPFQFIKDIIEILFREFDPKRKNKTFFELLDAIIIVIFLVLTITFFFFENASGIIEEYFIAKSVSRVPVLTIICLCLLAISCFLSPALIYLLGEQSAIDAAIKRIIEKTEIDDAAIC